MARGRGDDGLPQALTASGESLTASAVQIDPGDTKQLAAIKKRRKGWQNEAWRYYDELGEIWYANEFIGNALKRIRLYPAHQPDPEQPPIPADESGEAGQDGKPVKVESGMAKQAQVELERLNNGNGTGDILHNFGVTLGVPGESYLIGHEDEEGNETWGGYSSDQLKKNDQGQLILIEEEDQREGVVLTEENSTVVRIWRPHPRFTGLSNSPMRGVLDYCDELQILSRHIRATGRSRIAQAGLLLVPSEVNFGNKKPVTENTDGENGAARRDPLMADLIEHMTAPIMDEGVAAAAMPMLLKVPAKYIESFKYLEFVRSIDKEAAGQRQELIKRIAMGLDIPPEILLGLTDANHWTAWQVDEQTFKAHIEPLVIMVCNALTKGFLRPALGDSSGVNDMMVWYDASALVAHPNRTADAKDLHDKLVISDQALRQYAGFPESDAPDEEEIDRRIEQQRAIHGRQLEGDGGPVGGGPPPAPAPETTDPGPPGGEASARATVGSARAASTPQNPGRHLAQIDGSLRNRLLNAADEVVFAGIEKAGAKIRRKYRAGSDMALALQEVSNYEVASQVGLAGIRALGFSDDELVTGIADPLKPKWDEWVSRAQQQSRTILHEYDADEMIDYPALQTKQDNSREAGWILLAGLLTATAKELLFTPHPEAPAVGEFDSALKVGPGVVREALARAGGATGEKTAGGAILEQGGTVPAGGVAQGVDVLEVFRSIGQIVQGYAWIYGDPSSRNAPFEPHLDLDGAEFSSWDDPVLASFTDYPDVDFYRPGDHLYCQCDFEVSLTTRE